MHHMDHFKQINDTYGHQAGDEVLQRIAELLRDAARRPLDMPVRMGGEEFALLLYGSDLADAAETAERLRESLVHLALEHAQSQTAAVVTLSIGVACIHTGEAPLEELYAKADQALYRAKAEGRNRVVKAVEKPLPVDHETA